MHQCKTMALQIKLNVSKLKVLSWSTHLWISSIRTRLHCRFLSGDGVRGGVDSLLHSIQNANFMPAGFTSQYVTSVCQVHWSNCKRTGPHVTQKSYLFSLQFNTSFHAWHALCGFLGVSREGAGTQLSVWCKRAAIRAKQKGPSCTKFNITYPCEFNFGQNQVFQIYLY